MKRIINYCRKVIEKEYYHILIICANTSNQFQVAERNFNIYDRNGVFFMNFREMFTQKE